MQYYGTRQVAAMLGISPATINQAIWNNRLDPPTKSPSGNFLWTEQDIERASWALLHRVYEHRQGSKQ
jgi:hypothetical protein